MIIRKASAAISKAKEKFAVNKVFFVWIQGESDAIAGNSKEDYKEKLTEAMENILTLKEYTIKSSVLEMYMKKDETVIIDF